MLKWMIYDYPPHLRKRPYVNFRICFPPNSSMSSVQCLALPAVDSLTWAIHTYIMHICIIFRLMNNFGKNFKSPFNRLKGSCFQQDRQFIIPGHFDDSLLCCLLFPCLSFLEPRCIRKLAQCSHLPGTSQLYCTATSVFPSGGARHGARWSGPTISRYRKMTFADVSLDELTSQAVRPRSHGYWESGEQIWHKLA